VVELTEREADAGRDRVGVVVSGLGGLCNDVRAAAVAAGRKGRLSLSWRLMCIRGSGGFLAGAILLV
jgi:hypothetical protein